MNLVDEIRSDRESGAKRLEGEGKLKTYDVGDLTCDAKDGITVIDTNVLIDCFRSGDRASAVEEYDRILLSPVVLGEFRAGIDASTKHGRRAQRQLDEFIDDPAVVIVPCDYYAKCDWPVLGVGVRYSF